MTDTATMMKPTARVKPLTGLVWPEGYPECQCCHRVVGVDVGIDGLCGSCRAHHAELLDALRRALPFVNGQAKYRISFQEWPDTVATLIADIERLLGDEKEGEG